MADVRVRSYRGWEGTVKRRGAVLKKGGNGDREGLLYHILRWGLGLFHMQTMGGSSEYNWSIVSCAGWYVLFFSVFYLVK